MLHAYYVAYGLLHIFLIICWCRRSQSQLIMKQAGRRLVRSLVTIYDIGVSMFTRIGLSDTVLHDSPPLQIDDLYS